MTPADHAAMDRLADALAALPDDQFTAIVDRITKGRHEELIRTDIATAISVHRMRAQRAASAFRPSEDPIVALLAHSERAAGLAFAEEIALGRTR